LIKNLPKGITHEVDSFFRGNRPILDEDELKCLQMKKNCLLSDDEGRKFILSWRK